MHEPVGSYFSRLLEYFNNIFTYIQYQFKNGSINFCSTLLRFEEWIKDYCNITKLLDGL